MTLREAAVLDVASLSHPGMVRPHNEDSIFGDGDCGLVILADGMGGSVDAVTETAIAPFRGSRLRKSKER